jgi:lysophospholipase L1-like esterase
MKLMLDIDIKSPKQKITYADKFFLIGSCFTEHIGRRLEELKFPVLQNPNGILFDPISVTKSLDSYIEPKSYIKEDLFFLNELWQSWNHHSHFSGINKLEVLANINESQRAAHNHLAKATWLIITLGSSFSYRLHENNQSVANCHRAPGQTFNKHLLTVEETTTALRETIEKLQAFNPLLQVLFTISPVRHIRDGVVENNRSKARLIEAVHKMVEMFSHAHYFPAYELVIDVLRDYRFYDIDLVHPNYAATEFVFDQFEQSYIDEQTISQMEDIRKIMNAFKHKPLHPDTEAHLSFLQNSFQKVMALQNLLPHLNFKKEVSYFSRKGD